MEEKKNNIVFNRASANIVDCAFNGFFFADVQLFWTDISQTAAFFCACHLMLWYIFTNDAENVQNMFVRFEF